MEIRDFIENVSQITSRAELFECYVGTLYENFGADRVIYSFLTDHALTGQKCGHGVLSEYPEDWVKHYFANGYIKVDPVCLHLKTRVDPFEWNNLTRIYTNEENLAVMRGAEEAGLFNGVGIPLHGARSELAGAGVAFSNKNDKFDNPLHIAELGMITRYFHSAYCALDKKVLPVPELTKREKEVLQFMAIGKTNAEIATIFSCSLPTIKFHVKNIFEKLNTENRMLAVVKALRFGLVYADAVRIV